MTSVFSLRKLLVPYALAAIAGIGAGCVISVGGNSEDPTVCGTTNSHSMMTSVGCQPGEDQCCKCDPTYQWEQPNNQDNYHCIKIPPKSGCDCTDPHTTVSGNDCTPDGGYKWCSDNPSDCSACPDDQQSGGGTGGATGGATGNDGGSGSNGSTGVADTGAGDGADSSGGGPACEQVDGTWNGVEPDPSTCTANDEGVAFCSNNSDEGPAGSRYWECSGGSWVEQPTVGDTICQMDGYDFSYGCVDNADTMQIDHICGFGNGMACSGPECDACLDGDTLSYCSDNKAAQVSCTDACTVTGDSMGVTYDMGECADTDQGPACCCRDAPTDDCVFV